MFLQRCTLHIAGCWFLLCPVDSFQATTVRNASAYITVQHSASVALCNCATATRNFHLPLLLLSDN